jgi:hypothetical protein
VFLSLVRDPPDLSLSRPTCLLTIKLLLFPSPSPRRHTPSLSLSGEGFSFPIAPVTSQLCLSVATDPYPHLQCSKFRHAVAGNDTERYEHGWKRNGLRHGTGTGTVLFRVRVLTVSCPVFKKFGTARHGMVKALDTARVPSTARN